MNSLTDCKKCQFKLKHGREVFCRGGDIECEYKADFKVNIYYSGYNLKYYPCYEEKTEGFRRRMRD